MAGKKALKEAKNGKILKPDSPPKKKRRPRLEIIVPDFWKIRGRYSTSVMKKAEKKADEK